MLLSIASMYHMFINRYLKQRPLTHSRINHFEIITNSKKLHATTEMWLLKDLKMNLPVNNGTFFQAYLMIRILCQL